MITAIKNVITILEKTVEYEKSHRADTPLNETMKKFGTVLGDDVIITDKLAAARHLAKTIEETTGTKVVIMGLDGEITDSDGNPVKEI